MNQLRAPGAQWAGDTGAPDLALRGLLAQADDDPQAYLRAVAGLCLARLLLPVLATGEDGGAAPDPDRHTQTHVASMVLSDGRTATPVFTGLDSLVAWRSEARPVPCRLDEVAIAAGAGSVLVDIAGPHPLVIEPELVSQFASRRRLVELPDGGWGWLFTNDSSAGTSAG